MKNLSSYSDKFQLLGLVRFEIGEIKGQPEKYALLNQKQTGLMQTDYAVDFIVPTLQRHSH